MKNQPILPLLRPGQPFPPASQAWPAGSPAPGLLAAGGALDVDSLLAAYSQGIFPWFSVGEPILWWSPDPRMVLHTEHFRLHRSLRRTLRRFIRDPGCALRFDSDFARVMRACATVPRPGQSGTWIVPRMLQAYRSLHALGHAHSVETWIDGRLAGGLYCVSIGRAVFGESMFAHRSDASKIALAGLVAWCRAQAIPMIDCQQNTAHLASLGAEEMPRALFVHNVSRLVARPAPAWHFDPGCWKHLIPA